MRRTGRTKDNWTRQVVVPATDKEKASPSMFRLDRMRDDGVEDFGTGWDKKHRQKDRDPS